MIKWLAWCRHPTLGQFLVYYGMDSVPPYLEPSLWVLTSGVVLVTRYQSPFLSSSWRNTLLSGWWRVGYLCAQGLAATYTELPQARGSIIHNTVFVCREVTLIAIFLCLTATGRLHSTHVRIWVLDHSRPWHCRAYLRLCLRHVLWTSVLPQCN